MKKTFFSIIIVVIILISREALAGEKEFKIALSNDTVFPGRHVTLAVVFEGTDDIPVIELPYIPGVDIKFQEAARGVEEIEGEQVKVIMFTYSIVGFSEGEYTIGPISFDRGPDTYRSNSVVLKVSSEAKGAQGSDLSAEKDKSLSERMFLEVDLPDREIHVNEKVPVTVRFYTDWLDVVDLKITDVPSKNYISEEYEPKPTTIEERDGVKYAVLRFDKSFFVSVPGDFVFGPVKATFFITKAQGDLLNRNESFYNEYLGRKHRKEETLETGPFDVKVVPVKRKPEKKAAPVVEPGQMAAALEETEKKEEGSEKSPGEMIVGIKKHPGRADNSDEYFFKRKWFAVFEMLPLLLIPLAVLIKRRREMTAPDTPYGRLLRASRKAEKALQSAKRDLRRSDQSAFHSSIFNLLQEYIGTRCNVEPGGITEDTAENRLRARIKDEEVYESIRRIYSECYFANYTKLKIESKDMLKTYKTAVQLIKRLNREKEL